MMASTSTAFGGGELEGMGSVAEPRLIEQRIHMHDRGIRLATLNCHTAIAPKVVRIFDLLNAFHVDICALQECRIPPEGRASFCNMCSKSG